MRPVIRTHCRDCGAELTDENASRKRPGSTQWVGTCRKCRTKDRRTQHDKVESRKRLFVTRVVCDICGQPERAKRAGKVRLLTKDHDHSTGEWRGVLCSRCNLAIGLFSDNVRLLRRAIDYLEDPPGLVLVNDDPPETRQKWRTAPWYLAKYGPWKPDGTHPPSP